MSWLQVCAGKAAWSCSSLWVIWAKETHEEAISSRRLLVTCSNNSRGTYSIDVQTIPWIGWNDTLPRLTLIISIYCWLLRRWLPLFWLDSPLAVLVEERAIVFVCFGIAGTWTEGVEGGRSDGSPNTSSRARELGDIHGCKCYDGCYVTQRL